MRKVLFPVYMISLCSVLSNAYAMDELRETKEFVANAKRLGQPIEMTLCPKCEESYATAWSFEDRIVTSREHTCKLPKYETFCMELKPNYFPDCYEETYRFARLQHQIDLLSYEATQLQIWEEPKWEIKNQLSLHLESLRERTRQILEAPMPQLHAYISRTDQEKNERTREYLAPLHQHLNLLTLNHTPLTFDPTEFSFDPTEFELDLTSLMMPEHEERKSSSSSEDSQ